MRIQADPDALAARQIGIDQLDSAIAAANVNQPTGAINGDRQAASINADGQLNDAADFGKQVIAYRNGAPVRLNEVATVVDGSRTLGRHLDTGQARRRCSPSIANPAPTRWR